jgi:starch-binding outer membrane protein SusE/F
MKYLSKLFVGLAVVLAFFACEKKVPDLPFYKNGIAPALTASTTTIAPTATDSDNVALTLNWTYPKYATDSSNVKYTIEIDSAGRNFSQAYTRVVMDSLHTSFLAKDLNNILLGFGFNFNTPYNVDIRLTSSYANNNERIQSNVITVKATPYVTPPKVTPPTSNELYLVGDATQGGWNNPVPSPAQKFAKLDSVTYAGVFNLVGGKQYLVLPVNGSWDTKYSVQDNSIANLANGGSFGLGLPANFPGPATSGWYKIVLNFQYGTFSVTPFAFAIPDSLFIVGDATTGGWNNPVPVPSQKLTRTSSSEFSITLPLVGGKQYLLLPVNGSWDHKFLVADNSISGLAAGGDLGYDLPADFPGPDVNGTYNLTVNFAAGSTGQFKLVKQ